MLKYAPILYYVLPDKIAKLAKVAGLSLDELVEDACERDNIPPSAADKAEVKSLVMHGGPTRKSWIVDAIAQTLCTPVWTFVRYKPDVTYKYAPLDGNIHHYRRNHLINNPFGFVYLNLLRERVTSPDDATDRNASGRLREAMFHQFEAVTGAERVEMFRQLGMALELFLYVDASIFFPSGDVHEGAELNMQSIHAFRRVLETARPFYGRVTVIFLWDVENATKGDLLWHLHASLLSGMSMCSLDLAIPKMTGAKYKEIFRWYDKAGEQENLFLDYHVVDSHLEDYSASERTTLPFYYADSPHGFTEDDADEFLYSYIRCQ